MKITLINVQTIDGNNLVPPRGILSIAAMLEKEGFEVQVIDRDPEVFDFTYDIKKFNPDAIGIGFLTTLYKKAFNLTKKLKQKFPNAIYFCGGIHTTIEPINVLKRFGVDFVVVGEGEITTLEACKRLRNGKSMKGVKGVIYRGKNKIIINDLRPLIKDLDSIPFKTRHLINFEKEYLTFPGVIRGHFYKSTSISASRGCPYHCIYCNCHTIFGRKVRIRSVENVIKEIEYLRDKYGVKGIWFDDDTFTVYRNWVLEFSREMKRRNVNVKWGCQARVNTVDRELLKKMKSGGCIHLAYGVESGSEKVLMALKKETTPEMIRKAFKLTKEVGLETAATFMIGNPCEIKEDIIKTFELAKEIYADYTVFFFTTPFPGTELYNMAIKNKWIDIKKDFSEAFIYRQSKFPVMCINFSKEELASIRSKLQNYFFIRNYFHIPNLRIGLHLLYLCIKNPRVLAKGLSNFLKIRRIDSFLESILNQYRIEIIKSKI